MKRSSLVLLALLAVMILADPPPALAAEHNDVITKIEARLENNSAPMVNVGQWQVIRLNATFDLSDHDVHAGDTTTIRLPNELRFFQTAGFPIMDSTGEHVVANAVINGPAKTITLTYTDYPETHSGTNGGFFFYARIDRTVVAEEMDIPLNFNVSGEIVYGGTIHFVGYPTPTGSVIGKSGEMVGGTEQPRHLRYQLNVNTIHRAMKDVVITDLISSPGITIDKDSFTIIHCNWQPTLGDWAMQGAQNVTSQYTVQWNEAGNGFSLPLGDLGVDDGFQIRYTATANYDFVDGEVIRNRAELSGSDTELNHSNGTVSYFIAGGMAEGYVYTIQVLKTEEGQVNTPLSGAIFEVIRVRNNAVAGTITTGADGTGSITGLLKDTYKLVEIQAPTGYVPSNQEVLVYPADFNENKIALLTIGNAPETVSLAITKEWIGSAAESVTIMVKADGVDTGWRSDLSERTNWSATFDGLPKYDATDGHPIYYSVEEERPLNGYQSNVKIEEGEAENQWIVTITNTNIETINIPVQKNWVGTPAGKVTVHLSADGRIIDTKDLTADDNWQHTFTGLPKYDSVDGRAIQYNVTEEDVPGYAPGYSGTVETGFTFTNTITGKVSIPVTKVWIGPTTESITVNLLADGIKKDEAVLNADNNWQHTFVNLDQYSNGVEIQYRVEEPDLTGYASAITYNEDGSVTITNTNVETVDITGKKTWDDGGLSHDNAAEITLTLMRLSAKPGAAEEEVAVHPQWGGDTYRFDGLPKYDPDGYEYQYTVRETQVSGYMEPEQSGNDFINRLITPTPVPPTATPAPTNTPRPTTPPSPPNQYHFKFTKEWSGGREDQLLFTLYREDGSVYQHRFNRKKISENQWLYEAWLSSGGNYYVIENVPSGYHVRYENVGEHAAVTDRCYNGGKIINHLIPKTGDKENPVLWATLSVAAAVCLIAIVVHAVKSNKKYR